MISLWTGFLLVSWAQTVLSATITTTTGQTIYGIGASGAWWPNDLALFPESSRAEVAQLLFDKITGLGMTDYRYNLGGGGVGVTTFARVAETPYISDGVYNFSADAAGTYFLKEAARYGVPIITLFVNSAPTTFTNNSANCGGTLITERIDAYAQYVTDVISYWSTQGVKITHMSPMNEPDNSFGDGEDCDQEGMQVLPTQRAQIVKAFASAFAAANLSTKVISDESSSTGTFFADAPVWLAEGGPYIAGVAHHQYGFANNSRLAQLGALARSLSGGVSPWFTEICCYVEADPTQADDPLAVITYGASYDPTMVSALRMGNLIWQSFTQSEDEHWDFWTALSSGYGTCAPSTNASCVDERNYDGWDDGLLYYDPDYSTTEYYTISVPKRYWVLKHFTSAVPVGATRVNVTSVEPDWLVTAFNYPGTDRLYSVVAMNAQQNSSTLSLVAEGGLPSPSVAFTTNPYENFVPVEAQVTPERSLVFNAPAMSTYTIFF